MLHLYLSHTLVHVFGATRECKALRNAQKIADLLVHTMNFIVAKITSQNTGHFRWRSNVFQQILLTSMKKLYFSFNPPKVVKVHYLDCSLTQKERVALQILDAPKQVHILIKFSDQTVEEFSNEIWCYFLRIVGKLVCSVVFQTLFKRMLFCECFLPCELTVIAENLIIFF